MPIQGEMGVFQALELQHQTQKEVSANITVVEMKIRNWLTIF